MKHKNEVFPRFQEYLAAARNKFNRKLCILQTDNVGEYVSEDMKNYLKKKVIEHQLTIPYTPEQNGVAECKNCSLTDMAKCMLLDANLHNNSGEKLW